MREKSLQKIVKVISTLQKAIESLQEKDHQGGDRSHEHHSVEKAISGVVDAASLSSWDKRRRHSFRTGRGLMTTLGVTKDVVRATVQTSLAT